jgi:gluconolactonase
VGVGRAPELRELTLAAPEVIATGIRFPEGPVWCPAVDGRAAFLVCTSVADGALKRISLRDGSVEQFGDVGGGANAAQLASDDGFVVTQNGGIDFAAAGLSPDDPPVLVPETPSIQRVDAAGHVSTVIDKAADGSPFLAPNDLAVANDGTLWFTDPPHYPPPDEPVGRVHALAPDGTIRLGASGFQYCNGIAIEADDTPVVVEALGLLRLHPDGSREWITEVLGKSPGDGFCIDEDGRFYVAVTADHGIRVLERDGTEVEFLPIPGSGLTTNCCFGGGDRRTLFATDGLPGQIVAWENMPTAGLELTPWPA